MSLNMSRNRLSIIAVTVMFIVLALDMGGNFGVRNVVLPLCSVILLWANGLAISKGWLLPFGMLVACPAISLLIGVIDTSDLSLALSQFQSTALAFIIFLLLYKVPYQESIEALVFAMSIVACLAISLAIGMMLGIHSVSEILNYISEKGGGYFGERGVGVEGVIPNVYFKSTLFFVPTFLYSMFTKRYWVAIVCFLALIAAVSKTGIVISVIVAFTCLLWNRSMKSFFIGGVLLFVVVFFIVRSPLYFLFAQIANNESGTVSTRLGHLESLINLWGDNPLNFLFGFGLGSTFYSSGVDSIVSNIEIDHFNVVRKYGFLWAIIFWVWILNTAYVAMKNSHAEIRGIGWSLLIAFLVAGTNPVLISPLFFVFLYITMSANDQSNRNKIK